MPLHTYQTEGGMVLWLFGLSKDDSIQLTILNVDGHTLDYKINEHGERISFQADRKSLLEIADTVWGNPDNGRSRRTRLAEPKRLVNRVIVFSLQDKRKRTARMSSAFRVCR